MNASNSKQFYPSAFTIDDGVAYNGFTCGATWNGWQCPYFVKTEAERILSASADPVWYFEESRDSFVITFNDCDDSPEECKELIEGQDIIVNGETIHVYAIGNGSWVWDFADDSPFYWTRLAKTSAERVIPFLNDSTPPVIAESPAQDLKAYFEDPTLKAERKTSAEKFLGKVIYSVTEELQGGYLPNGISYFATKAEAESYMKDRKASAIEDGYKVSGSTKDGFYSLMPADSDDHTLGESITLQTGSAGQFVINLPAKIDSIESLVQYLNDNYA